ncbi:MAG: CopD family protein [Gemmatimonas sp.]
METTGLVARLVSFVANLTIVGAVGFRLLVLTRSGLSNSIVQRGSRRSASLGAMAGALLIVANLAKLVVQTAEMRFATDPWVSVGLTMLLETSWGTVWIVQTIAALLVTMTFTLARKDALPRWNVLAILALVVAASASFSSHAMSAARFGSFAIASDVLHIIGASLWIGTLFVMFVSVVGGDGIELQSPVSASEMRANYIIALLRSFSPLALAGSGIIVVSGVASTLAHVHTVAEFTGSGWGQMLIYKLIWLAAVMFLGYRNWKVVTPRVAIDGPKRMTRGMAIELVLVLVVLVITSVLVVTPPPGEGMG